jgi:cyclic 2,3-diphosphoglycerate synthetase
MRTLVLVDGEHYPPVTRWALDAAREAGHDVLAALFVGGTEKIDPTALPDLGLPVLPAAVDRMEALGAAIDRWRPEVVLDLSDDPVLGYRERCELLSVALSRGVSYLGADFRVDPPVVGPSPPVPAVAVIGTGKRTGKTALGSATTRRAATLGLDPVLVAMGRGGPAEPQIAEASSVDLASLLARAAVGQHAASDYLEDALMTGVTTIGARRAGGGLAGAPYVSNVRDAVDLAVARSPGMLVMEGSGSAVPPVPWDAGILVAAATAPEEYLRGYLGPYRVLLCDLIVVTMATGPDTGSDVLSTFRSHVSRLNRDARTIVTDLVPVPLEDVRGERVFFATTAPPAIAEKQILYLEETSGCRIAGWSSRLADRAGLLQDLEEAPRSDVLLTELKAAAIDVAAGWALEAGARVVFVENRPVSLDGGSELDEEIDRVLGSAGERWQRRDR